MFGITGEGAELRVLAAVVSSLSISHSLCGIGNRSYLLHSWWDVTPVPLSNQPAESTHSEATMGSIPSSSRRIGMALENFDGQAADAASVQGVRRALARLQRFLSYNTIRLLRDLMSVVDLRNVNHENICVLNTAIVIFIFAHRR